MLNWSISSDEICSSIGSHKSKVKFILKTKDDIELLEGWILHHLNIAGPDSLIIFDNFSTNKAVYDIYTKYKNVIKVFGWDVNHNLIHDVDFCPNLYEAIRGSCKFYSFLDTDERAYWTDGRQFFSNQKFLDHLQDKDFDLVYPGLWLINHPGSSSIYNISDVTTRFKSELKGGKPLIGSKVEVRKFINHNVQLISNNSILKIEAGFIVCHLLHIYPTRRIRINISKCIAHGFCKSENEINEIIDNKGITELSGSFRVYVDEIAKCKSITISNLLEPQNGQLQIQSSGLLKFGSTDAKTMLEEFASNSYSVEWKI